MGFLPVFNIIYFQNEKFSGRGNLLKKILKGQYKRGKMFQTAIQLVDLLVKTNGKVVKIGGEVGE